MMSPIVIALLMFIAYRFAPQILKYRKQLYIGVWGLLLIVFILRDKAFMTPFVKGFVGFAFFYIVMIAGALDPKWKLTKKLRSVRGPYSIIGFVLLIAHPLNYAAEVLSQTREIPYFGIMAFSVMIPLFVTSYMAIRKRMKAQSWIRLQKWAYLSYALILIHLIVNASSPQNRIVAIILFVPYVALKFKKEYVTQRSLVKA